MNILTKQGVWLAGINDFFLTFIEAVDEIWTRWGDTPIITSGAEGKHMEGSKHYKNEAWDLRVWGLHDPTSMADELRNKLNEDGEKWLVLFGDKDHKDHIHVQTLN